MRSLVILVAVLLMALTASALTEREYMSEFTKFMIQYNKRYSAEELFMRFDNFKVKLDLITKFNAEGHSSTMGINEFSDMSSVEMKKKMNGYRPRTSSRKEQGVLSNFEIPASVDWRSKGAVTPIKDQGQCGSCWAFSSTGSIEGAHQISTGKLVSLSEQQLMDCSTAEGDSSCEGGLMDDAFKYVIDNHGICSEAEYPYVEKDESCKTGCAIAATISSFVDVTSLNETALTYAVAQQPVSIAIEADQDVFQNYQSGILNSTACGTTLDHGVLLVGYGVESSTGQEYWILKNSWGTSWGLQGYAYLARGINQCGLALEPSYPVV